MVLTIHGLIMIFYMVMPIMVGGFGNYMIPLMIKVCDMRFPRLNGLSLSLGLVVASMFVDRGGGLYFITISYNKVFGEHIVFRSNRGHPNVFMMMYCNIQRNPSQQLSFKAY
uniref:Cytochrome c oxidase subunit 1 n=1 Tax=Syphacia muris TaxID=451379 RepID=A0A0N5AYV9_9BILA